MKAAFFWIRFACADHLVGSHIHFKAGLLISVIVVFTDDFSEFFIDDFKPFTIERIRDILVVFHEVKKVFDPSPLV